MRRAVETIFGGSAIDADTNSHFGKVAEEFRTRV